jgi:YggT family protein
MNGKSVTVSERGFVMGGFQPIHAIAQLFFGLLIIIMIVSMVLSWLPMPAVAPVKRFLDTLTQPIVGPLDQRIPPFGIFRLSFLIAFWALLFARALFLAALPPNW